MFVSDNTNLFNHSACTDITDRQTDSQTDRQDYYGNTALCTNVHHTVKVIILFFH